MADRPAPLPGQCRLADSPARRQPRQAAQHEGRSPCGILGIVQRQPGQPAQQGGNSDLGFETGQLRTQAVVDATAERLRPDVGPGGVQLLGMVRVGRRVVVGRSQQAQQIFTPGDGHAAQVVDVFERHSTGELHR